MQKNKMQKDRIKRYLEKIELGEERLSLVNQLLDWRSEIEKLACFKAYQEVVEIIFDLTSMLLKDLGKVVEDDYSNLSKLLSLRIFSQKEIEQMKEANRLRNWMVHRYNKLEETEIKEMLPGISSFLARFLQKFKNEIKRKIKYGKEGKNKSIQDKSIQKILLQLRKDFSFLKPKVDRGEIHVLLYGSYAKGIQTKQSDVDVCIVAPKYKTPKQRAKLIKQIWRKLEKPYDVRIFETFPLYLKIDIINSHKVVYSKNYPELTYYFYFYRKLWQDQAICRLKE
jgi:uncharacterized protein YutE (UPF0331/DUF86 family)/predicted nucleotidyltransferase